MNEGIEKYYLMPGQMFYSGKPVVVHTVLGSCVAVTMFSKKLKLGAICHALLPEILPSEEEQDVFKYVNSSVTSMVDLFHDLGVNSDEIELKCFGGGDMFETISAERQTVGKQNILTLKKTLYHLKLFPISEDMGGNYGRQIYFNTLTGEVLRKKVMKISNG